MKFTFYKYQGTGNDFILIDNRQEKFDKNNVKFIAHLCDQKFGIGADGLLLLEKSSAVDFKMVYYNADGNESTMCGNGGRCIVAFAKKLGIISDKTTFEAIDGLHYATINEDIVSLQMIDVDTISKHDTYLFLDTGSPHHVAFIDNVKSFDVKTKGKEIRYGKPYFEEGTNVNFVEQTANDSFKVRTYERGVEDETLSCGTGVTAVALAAFKAGLTTNTNVKLETLGGMLEVSFNTKSNHFNSIFLKGPATFVFEGKIENTCY